MTRTRLTVVALALVSISTGTVGYAQTASPLLSVWEPSPLSLPVVLAPMPDPLSLPPLRSILWPPLIPLSALNPLSPTPPILVDRSGRYWGELSTNRFRPDSISNPFGRYGSPYSMDSLVGRPLVPLTVYVVPAPPPTPARLLQLVPIQLLPPRK